MRRIPWLSSCLSPTFSVALQKLGQPVPESNLASEGNNSAPQPPHMYLPVSLFFSSAPVNGPSVPFSLRMRYCSDVSFLFHSSSPMPFAFSSVLAMGVIQRAD